MFKKSTSKQIDMFECPESYLSEKEAEEFYKPLNWHIQFYENFTSKVDESLFADLYKEGNMGAPNREVRVLMAIIVIKEGLRLSDRQMFERVKYDMQIRYALGYTSFKDEAPTQPTYYKFRARVEKYKEDKGVDLFENCFKQVTKSQCMKFHIAGEVIRMDSKIIGSNIAHYSRYEIVLTTFRQQVEEFMASSLESEEDQKLVKEFLKENGKNTIYTTNSEGIFERLMQLGQLIQKLLDKRPGLKDTLLGRVFDDQFYIDESTGELHVRDKKTIKPTSVQNPNDPDAEYRKKNGEETQGYVTNFTENVAEKGELSLITAIDLKGATAADPDFLEKAITDSQEVTQQKVKAVHTDGAYQSQHNREYCQTNQIDFMANGFQGRVGRIILQRDEHGNLVATDRETGEILPSQLSRNGKSWRIETIGMKTKFKYVTEEDLERSEARMRVENMPIEERNKRHNVEATIFQYCFHSRGNKLRYRGLERMRMHAYARGLWCNTRRIVIFEIKKCQRTYFALSEGFFVSMRARWTQIRAIIGRLENMFNPGNDWQIIFLPSCQ